MSAEQSRGSDPVDIADPLRDVLERMGFKYNDVLEVTWWPQYARVTTLVRNASGIPVVNGGFMTENHQIRVQT